MPRALPEFLTKKIGPFFLATISAGLIPDYDRGAVQPAAAMTVGGNGAGEMCTSLALFILRSGARKKDGPCERPQTAIPAGA
jgi:hypothetical protein